MVCASANSPRPSGSVKAGGGVWTPVAVVRTRLALQRGQLFAEKGISLPQRLQTMENACFSAPDRLDNSMATRRFGAMASTPLLQDRLVNLDVFADELPSLFDPPSLFRGRSC